MPREPDIFVPLMAWIEERLDDHLTLELIAQRAGFSAYHFSRMFTAAHGPQCQWRMCAGVDSCAAPAGSAASPT